MCVLNPSGAVSLDDRIQISDIGVKKSNILHYLTCLVQFKVGIS